MATMLEYISNISFALNFEDHRNSVQVRSGETVRFDGTSAFYTKRDGTEVSGRAPSLRQAINMKWLAPKVNGKVSKEQIKEAQKTIDRVADRIPLKTDGSKYDELKGGSFDEMLAKEQAKDKIIREDDITARKTDFKVPVKEETKHSKLEVAGDQVEVKDSVRVNSSTTIPPVKSHTTKVEESDHYGASSSKPLKSAISKKVDDVKSSSFTVDASTPSVSEGATLAEVKRATTVIKNESESQDAKIVKPIKKASLNVESTEGVILKKSEPEKSDNVKEGVVFRPSEKRGLKAFTEGVSVSSGGEAVTEIQEGVEGVKVVSKKASEEAPNYLSMLPDDWGDLHWTRKEKFIKVLTDKDFIKFIMSVENIDAVKKSCQNRLDELNTTGN